MVALIAPVLSRQTHSSVVASPNDLAADGRVVSRASAYAVPAGDRGGTRLSKATYDYLYFSLAHFRLPGGGYGRRAASRCPEGGTQLPVASSYTTAAGHENCHLSFAQAGPGAEEPS